MKPQWALIFAWFLWASPVLAQVEPATEPSAESSSEPVIVVPEDGTEIFRHLLWTNGYTPLREFSNLLYRPTQSLLVIFGDTDLRKLGIDQAKLHNFLNQGGAILLCTDKECQWLGWIFGCDVVGSQVYATQGRESYRGIKECPLLRISPELEENPRSILSVFQNVSVLSGPVATKCPSYIEMFRNSDLAFGPIAGFPSSCRTRERDRLNPRFHHFAAGGYLGLGRIMVMADQSLFLNELMIQDDNRNYDLAKQTIRWLKESSDEFGNGIMERKYCYFLENGMAQSRFDIPIPERPKPPFNVMANMFMHRGNQLIGELQEKNFFNRLITDTNSKQQIIRFVLILATLILLLLGIFWVWNSRFRSENYAFIAEKVTNNLPFGNALQWRQQARSRVTNHIEPLQVRIREIFDQIEDRPAPQTRRPTLWIDEDYVDTRSLRRSIQELWHLGYQNPRTNISKKAYDRLTKDLRQVAQAKVDGFWRFEPPGRKTS